MKKRYCPNGHDTFKVGRVKRGRCKRCVCVSSEKARLKKPEYYLRYAVRYRKKNHKKLVDKLKIWNWKNAGINVTLQEYYILCRKQKSRCAICYKKAKKLAVDHDHKTGQIRGLLCTRCNRTLLPIVEFHYRLLDAAKKYLQNQTLVQS